jgi:hypothetical protein
MTMPASATISAPAPSRLFPEYAPVAGKRQHFLKQTPHLPAAADNHHRAQIRTKRFEAFVVFAGIGLASRDAEHLR